MIDTHGGGLFVAKFRGAGQGVKALIAELIVGMLARHAGLPTPEPALIEIPDSFGRTEPDPEIQEPDLAGRQYARGEVRPGLGDQRREQALSRR